MPSGIYIRTEEIKKTQREGVLLFNSKRIYKKGWKASEETKLKISKGIKKHLPSTTFKKGSTPFNKGRVHLSKERHWNWQGGITTENNSQRGRFRRTIQKEVFKRDNYTCQFCGTRGGNLQVDHIQSWKDYVELRFSMENCRTLCVRCHYEITWKKPMLKSVKAWGQHKFMTEKEGV